MTSLIDSARQTIDDIIDPLEKLLGSARSKIADLNSLPVIGDLADDIVTGLDSVLKKIAEVRAKLAIPDDIGGDTD